jgi:hypothetical protein
VDDKEKVMSISHLLFPLVAMALLTLLCLVASPSSAMLVETTQSQASEEDFTVYGALIEYLYEQEFLANEKKLLVIHSQTVRGIYFDGNLDKTLRYVKKGLPALLPEILESYKAINRKAHTLVGRLPIKSDHIYVTSKDVTDMFREKSGVDGWKSFYLRYPEAGGLLGFSRVAYNKSGTEALVFASCVKNSMNFFTCYYLLVKEDGLWKVRGEVVMAVG